MSSARSEYRRGRRFRRDGDARHGGKRRPGFDECVITQTSPYSLRMVPLKPALRRVSSTTAGSRLSAAMVTFRWAPLPS